MSVKIDPELKIPERFQEWRDDQYNAVTAIADSERPHFLLDAPTGIGKSLIGIGTQRIKSYKAEQQVRMAYLCGTKQLQDQIMRDFGDIAVSLKGKSNYPCLLREDAFPDISAEDCNAGNPRECQHYRECGYFRQKELAKKADIVVLNNAYFLNEANGWQSSFSGADIMIADEVDALDNALMNYIEFKITSSQLEHYNLLPPADPEKKESWLDWIPGAIVNLEQQISRSEGRLRQCGFANWGKSEIHENKNKKAMQRLIDKLSFIQSEVDNTWIFYFQDRDRGGRGGYEFIFKPVTVGKYANRFLWDHAEYKVGMSGTILAADITCRELGIDECDYMRLDSPFPIENRPIYYKPIANITRKTMYVQLPILKNEIEKDLLKYPDRKVLIHTVSYDIQRYLRDNLSCQERLTWHTSMDREMALEDFKKSRRPLVMLSPSFDRGVDLREGDNVGAQMICKVPYLNLGDPQVKAKTDLPGGWTWYQLKATQTLLQMTGRSVRSARQKCDTYIYDEQFGRLRNQMKNAIPAWWMDATRDIRPALNQTGMLI